MENKILSQAPKNKLCDSKFVQECSVCLEPTKGKTPCQHFLCYPCWQGIQQRFCECRNESDEEIFCDRPCPVCRAPIENTELPFQIDYPYTCNILTKSPSKNLQKKVFFTAFSAQPKRGFKRPWKRFSDKTYDRFIDILLISRYVTHFSISIYQGVRDLGKVLGSRG